MRSYLKKNPSQKMVGGVAQSVGPEFKPQHYKKKKSTKYCFERDGGERVKGI
jgi:hypothetical protein